MSRRAWERGEEVRPALLQVLRAELSPRPVGRLYPDLRYSLLSSGSNRQPEVMGDASLETTVRQPGERRGPAPSSPARRMAPASQQPAPDAIQCSRVEGTFKAAAHREVSQPLAGMTGLRSGAEHSRQER